MGFPRGTKLAMCLILMVIILALNSMQTSGTSSFGSGRSLLQTEKKADNTVRVDPLDDFKKYRGGYDITNKHYWSSTVFTGIYGYALAVLWIFVGLVYGGYLLATTFCCKHSHRKLRKGTPCHEQCYLRPILLATFFTILVIVASGLVLGGNANFHSRAKTVVNIIIDTANEASNTIFNTTEAMKDIDTRLVTTSGNGETSGFLTSTSRELDSQAAVIERQAKKNRQAINLGLRIAYIVSTVIISLNLIAVIALSVFGILKLQRALHIFIILCWLLIVFCWLFFGIYFFIEQFAGDTCTALEGFQQDPYNNSLSSILPCDELLSAKSVLYDVSEGIYGLVNQVNTNISTSYANIVQICNPFSAPPQYQYQPENCPANAIRIGDIPQVLRMLTCSDAENGACNGGILISSTDFRTVVAYSTSVQNLLNVYPGMESLVECQTVKDAFSEILHKHCKPLKKNVRMVWAAMVFLSMTMVALVTIWIAKAHHERKHHFSDDFVKPHFAAANMLELGTTKATNNNNSS
ncbi:unnamed protein product [Ilex paraguariensis]|uniref:Uncharacterized protein n=1 Tax=Ilex paraguariensis TaxID=185542 RepID=A0ABC8UUV4_9AQUA